MGYYEKLIEKKNEFTSIYGPSLRVRKGKKRGHSKSVKIESRIGSSVFSFLCQFIFLTKMDGCFCEICALNYTETLQN